MFGRDKTQGGDEATKAQQAPQDPVPGGTPTGKGRPTPKRRDQEAARRRPLVVTDRKAARNADREKRREAMQRTRRAMDTGDEAHLPARDKGPVRRYIRDYVDARTSIGEFMLPVMLVVLALSFFRTVWAQTTVFLLVYGLLIVAVIDFVLMWRRLRKKLAAKFGAEAASQRGLTWYAVMRVFQMRPSRAPRPQVKRRQYPA